jgi:hypothetical protein
MMYLLSLITPFSKIITQRICILILDLNPIDYIWIALGVRLKTKIH